MPKLIKNLGVYRCIDVRTNTAASTSARIPLHRRPHEYRCIDVRTNTAASTSARKPLQPMVANQIGAHGI